jgi:hypothetical protein
MAAGNTYEAIATFTTTTSNTTSYTFSSIPGTYTDLVLVCNLKATSADSSIVARFNGDSGSNYSNTQLYGNGTSAVSQRFTSQTEGYLSFSGFPTATFGPTIVNFMNYANTTTNKTYIARGGYASGYVDTSVGLWRSTAAISSMTLYAGNFFDTGCTFSLYGIKSA